jgi:hypothetical protein
MSAKYENNLAAASQRFAAVLLAAPVADTVKTGLRDRRRLLFGGDRRRLWTTTFESDWHRYIGRTAAQTRSTQPVGDPLSRSEP